MSHPGSAQTAVPDPHACNPSIGRRPRGRLLAAAAAVALAVGLIDGVARPPAGPPAAFDEHCTSFVLDDRGQHLFATNYDRSLNTGGMVFVHPRGVVKTGLYPSTTGAWARWTARYASVAFSLLGSQHAWGGMNERGLVISTMSLHPPGEPPVDGRPPLDWLWGQYLLDTCETVDEVVASDAVVRTYIGDHYLVADRFGGVAVVEFYGGPMVSYRQPDLCAPALTNTAYSESCARWEALRQDGDYSGEDNSVQRFCRAADRVTGFVGTTQEAAVDFAFASLSDIYPPVLRGFTRWSIVYDIDRLRVFFTTQRHRDRRFVDLMGFDLACVSPTMMLDIDAPLSGDVGSAFTPIDHDLNRNLMESYYQAWGIPFDRAALDATVAHLASFTCIDSRRATGRRRPSAE